MEFKDEYTSPAASGAGPLPNHMTRKSLEQTVSFM